MRAAMRLVVLVGGTGALSLSQRVTSLKVSFRDVPAQCPEGASVTGECVGKNAENWIVKLYPNGRSSAASERGRAGVFISRSRPRGIARATFAVLLIGQQKFNIEGRGGAQFVDGIKSVDKSLGCVLEAGCPLVLPSLLWRYFMDSNGGVSAVVNITEHVASAKSIARLSPWLDARRRGPLHVGSQFVPVWRNLDERAKYGAMGCYGGVDYVVERVIHNNRDVFEVVDGSALHIRPSYPLVRRLERNWPVVVNETEFGLLLRPRTYTAVAAATTSVGAMLSLALSAFLATFVFSVSLVESFSMIPAITPGDLVFIEKFSLSTSKLITGHTTPARNDIIFFSPPPALADLAAVNLRDLFVKRVVALPGDIVDIDDADLSVKVNGRPAFSQPNDAAVCHDERARDKLRKLRLAGELRFPLTIPPGYLFMLGDCTDVSVDSRVWGPLPDSYVAGRPIATFNLRQPLQ